jgi:hypothetical protein
MVIYRLNPAVAWRSLDDKIFVYGEHGNTLHQFNETGEYLWSLLAQSGSKGLSVDELSRALCEAFTVSEAESHNDAGEFVENCLAQGLMLSGAQS